MYSTTYNSLNTALGGIQVEMQCNGPAELSREHILKKVKKIKNFKYCSSLNEFIFF